jgi:hypothetical protein
LWRNWEFKCSSRHFRQLFSAPVLQTGSRNTSLKLVAGVGVAPTEVELMRLP